MGDRQTRGRNAHLRPWGPWVWSEEAELTLRWLDGPVFGISDPARIVEELTANKLNRGIRLVAFSGKNAGLGTMMLLMALVGPTN